MPRKAPRENVSAAEFLLGRHWAMAPDDLRALQTAIAAKLDAGLNPQAVEAMRGRWMEGTWSGTIRDGVATIPVHGVLTRYLNYWSYWFGGTAYETIATDVKAALDNSEVRALILDVNSPGGEVDGADETAQLIRSLGEESGKEIVAYIGGKGLSGGYWLSVAASRIEIANTAMLGSIGTVLSWPDTRGFQKMIGIRDREFVSSQSPKKRIDPNSSAGQAEITALLDALADVFIDRVAAYRDTDRETVLSDYGQGGVLVGAAAVEAGLADRITTYEALHQELAGRETPITRITGVTMAKTKATASASSAAAAAKAEDTADPADDTTKAPKDGDDEDDTVETTSAAELAERYPEAVASFRAEGAASERERLTAIDKLAGPGRETVIAACKADPTCTAANAALRILTEAPNAVTPAGPSAAEKHLAALAGDEAGLIADGKPSAAAGQGDGAGADSVARRITSTYDTYRAGENRAAAARN